MEKYYKDLLEMPAVKSSKNMDGSGTITESTVNEIHKILRSAFRQAVKWDLMEKNPAVDATVPKAKTQEREIWTAEMLMQALAEYRIVCGRGNIRGTEGPRNAVATGLLLSYLSC